MTADRGGERGGPTHLKHGFIVRLAEPDLDLKVSNTRPAVDPLVIAKHLMTHLRMERCRFRMAPGLQQMETQSRAGIKAFLLCLLVSFPTFCWPLHTYAR